MLLRNSWMVFTCLFIFNTEIVHSRTTKSRKDRTSTQKRQTATTTSSSLLDRPQNDIYNNKVDEDVTLPILLSDPFTRDEKSRMSWNSLNRNNDRKPMKIFSRFTGTSTSNGPQGSNGAVMTKEEISKEYKKMIKDAANKKAKKIIMARCPSCDVKDLDDEIKSSFLYPGMEEKIKTINRAPTAFTTKLISKIDVYPLPDKLVQLKKFQLTGSEYDMGRGVPTDLGMNGKFTVAKTGIYQFTVTLNFHSGHKVATGLRSNFVQVLICPNGQCSPTESNKRHTATQYIHSMDSRQRYFTIQLTATLQLKKTDYVSVYVKNACRRTIDIQQGSLMTGIILSV